MELAALVGITITEFWDITPFELDIAVKSYRTREETRNKELIYQAYLISRWVWAKRVDIDKILKTEKKKKSMNDDEMLAQVKLLNNLFGGEVGADERQE